MNDLQDLFTLGSSNTSSTETGNLFRGAEKSLGVGSSDANHQLNKQQDDPSTLRAFGGVAGLEA